VSRHRTKRSKSKQRGIKLEHKPSLFFGLVQRIPEIVVPLVWFVLQFCTRLDDIGRTIDAGRDILKLTHDLFEPSRKTRRPWEQKILSGMHLGFKDETSYALSLTAPSIYCKSAASRHFHGIQRISSRDLLCVECGAIGNTGEDMVQLRVRVGFLQSAVDILRVKLHWVYMFSMMLLRNVAKHATERLLLSQFEVQIACLHMELRKLGSRETREVPTQLIKRVISEKETKRIR
jgi:hypothetical protein